MPCVCRFFFPFLLYSSHCFCRLTTNALCSLTGVSGDDFVVQPWTVLWSEAIATPSVAVAPTRCVIYVYFALFCVCDSCLLICLHEPPSRWTGSHIAVPPIVSAHIPGSIALEVPSYMDGVFPRTELQNGRKYFLFVRLTNFMQQQALLATDGTLIVEWFQCGDVTV
jgi:hypothetical protein